MANAFAPIKPILKAMLVCDSTIVESGTHKRSLIGLFDSIQSSQFPTVHPSMSVYVQFREIEGTFDFNLELMHLETNRVTHKAAIRNYRVSDKHRECELVFNLLSVKLEQPGDYEFRIYANDLIFGQKSFKVVGASSTSPMEGASE